MTYNDSDIQYGSNRELVFHGTIAAGVFGLIVGGMLFLVPLKEMPSTDVVVAEFPELTELHAAEETALHTTADNDDGSHIVPIEVAKAALVSNPGLLATAFGGMGEVVDPGVEVDPLVASGKGLFASKTCFTCHSLDGSRLVGPSFKGLMGRTTALADGTSVTADAAYITESIKEPMAKVVEGFPPAMPPLPITDEEITALIAYISTLQ